MDTERLGEGLRSPDAPWWVKVWIVLAFIQLRVTRGNMPTWWAQFLKDLPLLLAGVWLGIYLAARGQRERK